MRSTQCTSTGEIRVRQGQNTRTASHVTDGMQDISTVGTVVHHGNNSNN